MPVNCSALISQKSDDDGGDDGHIPYFFIINIIKIVKYLFKLKVTFKKNPK